MTRTPDPLARPELDASDYQALFEHCPGLYLVLSPELVIVTASEAYLNATMTARADIIGRPLFEVFPDNPGDPGADGVRNLHASLARVLRERVADAMGIQKYDIRRPAAQGGGFEERFWSPLNAPVLRPDGSLAWIIHRVEDVTELVRIRHQSTVHARREEELQHQVERMAAEVLLRSRQVRESSQRLGAAAEQLQRLETIGRNAAGIAHDFNNLLAVISGYHELLSERLEGDPAGRDYADEIRQAVERAGQLTRQLLRLGHTRAEGAARQDLGGLVSSLTGMLDRLLGDRHRLRLQVPEAAIPVRAERAHVERIVMNLVLNARDSMPKGGWITLRLGVEELAEAEAHRVELKAPGRYATLEVEDGGVGMDAETQARIFEPFFTTKGQAGSGMGLVTVLDLVRSYGGSIRLASAPGRGSRFVVRLPQASEPAARARDASGDAPDALLRLHIRNELLRVMLCRVLEARGYRVEDVFAEPASAPGAPAAALLVTDVGETDGRPVVERFFAERPDGRALILTDRPDPDAAAPPFGDPRCARLAERFRPAELLESVAALIAQRAGCE